MTRASALWAEGTGDPNQSKDSWENSDMGIDKDVENGSNDDKGDEGTEESKFQKDMDDAYQSNFKDERGDVDKDSDSSDQDSDKD